MILAQTRPLIADLARASSETAGHSLRVAAYARRVGEQLGLDRDELAERQQGAQLRDIGKR